MSGKHLVLTCGSRTLSKGNHRGPFCPVSHAVSLGELRSVYTAAQRTLECCSESETTFNSSRWVSKPVLCNT